MIFGGVPREGIEGEPGVVGELFKESEDCGRHLQSVPGIPVTALQGGPVVSHLSPSQHSTSSVSVKEKRRGYLERKLKEIEKEEQHLGWMLHRSALCGFWVVGGKEHLTMQQ